MWMQVDGSDIDVHVDAAACFVIDTTQKRVTFNAGGAVYAMRVQDEALFRCVGLPCPALPS